MPAWPAPAGILVWDSKNTAAVTLHHGPTRWLQLCGQAVKSVVVA
jgi:hypothetical protein